MALDMYANIATLEVTQSAANALSFTSLQTNVGISSNRNTGTAIIIDQIDYFPGLSMIQDMTAASDSIKYAITISDGVTDLLDFSDRRVMNSGVLFRHDMGTAAAGQLLKMPFTAQFFPPLIVAERQLYLGCDSVGLANAGTLRARIYYRTVELTAAEFVEVAEVFRLVS